MKLRLKNNSARLRLTRREVQQLVETGTVEEKIEFGLKGGEALVYALAVDADKHIFRAALENNKITIFVPHKEVLEWAETEKVGLETEQSIGDGKSLRILIEKDFACLAPRRGEDESDNFPHPSEGKIC